MDMGTVETIAGVLAFIIDAFATVMNFMASAIEWLVKTLGGFDLGNILGGGFDLGGILGGLFGGLFG